MHYLHLVIPLSLVSPKPGHTPAHKHPKSQSFMNRQGIREMLMSEIKVQIIVLAGGALVEWFDSSLNEVKVSSS